VHEFVLYVLQLRNFVTQKNECTHGVVFFHASIIVWYVMGLRKRS